MTTNIAIIGAGLIGKKRAKYLPKNIQLKIVCDINRQMHESVMDSNSMTNHYGYNGRCPGPRCYDFFFCFHIKLIHFS